MKEIKIKNSTNTISVPDHVTLKQQEAIVIKNAQILLAEPITSESYTERENRLSLTLFEEYENVRGEVKDYITINAMSLVTVLKKILPKYRKTTKQFTLCRDDKGKCVFIKNKMTEKQLALFQPILQNATFDMYQIEIASGSHKYDQPEQEYDSDVVYTIIENLHLESDEQSAEDLKELYDVYKKEEWRRIKAEVVAEANQPLPEL